MSRTLFLICIVLIGLTQSITVAAGNNAGAKARLSWSNTAFLPANAAALPWVDDLSASQATTGMSAIPLYVLIDGATDVRQLAITLRWTPADSLGCYSVVPVAADTSSCGWASAVPPGGAFDGDPTYTWSIRFPPTAADKRCVIYLISHGGCAALSPAGFCLSAVRVLDSSGNIDDLGVSPFLGPSVMTGSPA
jgi:hypothetical protein